MEAPAVAHKVGGVEKNGRKGQRCRKKKKKWRTSGGKEEGGGIRVRLLLPCLRIMKIYIVNKEIQPYI